MGGQWRSVKCTEGAEEEKQGKERLWDKADKREVREVGAVTITSPSLHHLDSLFIATSEVCKLGVFNRMFSASLSSCVSEILGVVDSSLTFCEAPQTMSRPDHLSSACNQSKR